MNHWHDEVMAEYDRRRILREVAQIRWEKLGLKSRADGPHLLDRTLFSIANWMISTGQQLRGHYEISQEERWLDPRTKATS